MVAAGSITVAVRVRPPTAWEAARLPEPCYETSFRGDGALSTPAKIANNAPLRDIVQIVDDRILTFDPDEKDRAKAFMERGFLPPGTKRYKDKRFMFDRVFGHHARQEDVYGATAQPLLKGLLDGYNATVFAYGATGCGKTHTISGTEADPGIIYLTMADLFHRIEERRDEWNIEVMVTFLEIYNEEIRDLLAEPGTHVPRGGLQIREDKTVKVVGLVELKPASAEEVKAIVLLGNTRRTQSPTHANETSSRSHAVLQIHVSQAPRTASLTEQRVMATLSIIDLAGSERAAATTNMGQRMVEGANINKSLLALGNCINALCESGGAIRHVPYRNSKLTRLLKFSLGGNCKTVMIVCVAPTSNHFDDTHNTLVYAERATKIKTKVVTRNVVNVDRHVGRYVEAINRLNIEIQELKDKLAGKRAAERDVEGRKRVEAKAEVDRARRDAQAKMEQTQASIIDGAVCSGKLSVAKVKLGAIQTRLQQIEGETDESALAEKGLLQALKNPEEDVLKLGSNLNSRLQKSSNSSAMFDATMRAVSERKSDKMDETCVDLIKLEAAYRRSAMDKLKAEKERDTLQEEVCDMADVMVKVLGMLGRCTVLVGEAAIALNDVVKSQEEPNPAIQRVASTLESVKEKNDTMFKALLGHSTESYVVKEHVQPTVFDSFNKNYGASFGRRISSGPPALQGNSSFSGSTRRSSVYGSLSASVSSPPRRAHKSPRKSLRSNLTQPYRRTSADKKPSKPVKTVQWRDEAGQGKLDDSSMVMSSSSSSTVVLSVTPASPATVEDTAATTGKKPLQLHPRASSPLVLRPPSALGSESEWEDEDKTDDNVNTSIVASLSASTSSLSASLSRRRPTRLDPIFKSKPKTASSLGSLVEDDESGLGSEARKHPLSDMSLNRMGRTGGRGGSDSDGSDTTLHVPKAKDRIHGSPNRRVPTTGKASTLMSSSVNGGKTGGNRRRSNIGPVRNEKTSRRRSSMIPQLSPKSASAASMGGTAGDAQEKPERHHQPPVTRPSTARRVLLASPGAKRVKRASLTKNHTAGSLRLGTKGGVAPLPNLTALLQKHADADTSIDMGPNKATGSRPTWR